MVPMLSPTLTRRYTPPTCSLEVAAKTSALSQWTGKPLIKELSFELSFDDPRLGPDQRIVIKGDRPQLDALAAAVNDYVQGFLQDLSPDLEWLPQATSVYGYHNTPGQTVATLPQPQLVTQGLLSHTLHLGRLATKESGPTLQLNATQLHDLAEALETYQTDMVALPSLTASQQRRTVTRWGAIAASVLLVVGISNAVWQQQQLQETDSALNLEATDEAGNQAELIPPDPHASYTFSPVPPAADAPLDNPRVAPQTVDLTQPAPGETTTANPTPSTAPAPNPPSNDPAPITAAAPRENASLSVAPSFAGQMARTTAVDQAEQFADAPQQEAIALSPANAPRLNPEQRVERHFQTQWQSPDDLGEVLEYRLKLSEQGAIETVFPIGKAAELYQPQLSFLSVGRNVGASFPAESRTFRLVLNPDGRVQAFTEAPR